MVHSTVGNTSIPWRGKMNNEPRQLIIGCGTGRCGTVSLTRFLNNQEGVSILHEGVVNGVTHHIVPWYEGEAQLWRWLEDLEKLTNGARWYGDVGPYFLPYVPKILQRYPLTRVICLERGRRAVVKSYLEKTKGRNHWYLHKGTGWKEDPEWDIAFPVYAEPNKARALELYWNGYHAKALEYQALFPDNFMLLPTSALNLRGGRLKLLEFLGIHGANKLEGQFHANRLRRRNLIQTFFRLISRPMRAGKP